MKLLEHITSLGYDVKINKGKIKLSYNGKGKPNKSRIIPLLKELKANKAGIIEELQKDKLLEPISDETLLDVYQKVMDKINASCITGTTPNIQEHNKQLDTEINNADDRVNDVWQRCNKGEVSLKDFEAILNTYQALYLKAIDIKRKSIPPTVEKLCKCGDPAATYCFGGVESGKNGWVFYCDSCNPHSINCSSSKCSFQAIPYINSSGKYIIDKCNVHGARLKVTHAEIDAWSRSKRKKMSYIT
jgi:hypothetical protein